MTSANDLPEASSDHPQRSPIGASPSRFAADGSFTGTATQTGVEDGSPATFTYRFSGHFHGTEPAMRERLERGGRTSPRTAAAPPTAARPTRTPGTRPVSRNDRCGGGTSWNHKAMPERLCLDLSKMGSRATTGRGVCSRWQIARSAVVRLIQVTRSAPPAEQRRPKHRRRRSPREVLSY
jgi:hypothetical protein